MSIHFFIKVYFVTSYIFQVRLVFIYLFIYFGIFGDFFMIKTKSLFFLFAMCFALNFSASAMEMRDSSDESQDGKGDSVGQDLEYLRSMDKKEALKFASSLRNYSGLPYADPLVIHWAYKGHLEIFKCLHSIIGDEDFKELINKIKGCCIYSVLHRAIISNNTKLMKFLLSKGSDVTALDMEEFVLHWQCCSQDTSDGVLDVSDKLFESNSSVFEYFHPLSCFVAKSFLKNTSDVDLTGRTGLEMLRKRCELYLQVNRWLVDFV